MDPEARGVVVRLRQLASVDRACPNLTVLGYRAAVSNARHPARLIALSRDL